MCDIQESKGNYEMNSPPPEGQGVGNFDQNQYFQTIIIHHQSVLFHAPCGMHINLQY
jgi:hypothetical protein